MLVSCGCDLGRSGHTAFSVVAGEAWNRLHLIHLETHASIMSPDVEKQLITLNAQFQPKCIVIESNGPGGPFAEYCALNNPSFTIYAVDVSLPPFVLHLWDNIYMDAREYVNVRAQEYFIVRYLIRAKKLTFAFEDAELFAQLIATYWGEDKSRGSKLRVMPKREMRIKDYTSELEGIQFSRSPDKADSLALACLGYAILMQEESEQRLGGQEEEIIQPDDGFEGFFNLADAGIEVE